MSKLPASIRIIYGGELTESYPRTPYVGFGDVSQLSSGRSGTDFNNYRYKHLVY